MTYCKGEGTGGRSARTMRTSAARRADRPSFDRGYDARGDNTEYIAQQSLAVILRLKPAGRKYNVLPRRVSSGATPLRRTARAERLDRNNNNNNRKGMTT